MREIKFRAWDTKNGEWINTETDWSILNGKLVGSYDPDMYAEHPLNYDLMQYTGQKDRKGMEIYEGDIVRVWVGEYEVSQQAVEWSKEEMGWSIGGLMGHDYDQFEVIGNIYENPELLK